MIVCLSKFGKTMSIKDLKTKYIIESATELFLKGSIEAVTVKEIAIAAEMGEATVYRYFSSKKNIVTRCALYLQDSVYRTYFKLSGESGFDKLAEFYNSYLTIFCDHAEYYKFINEFDGYMLREDKEGLDEYSDGLDLFKKEYFDAYHCGIKDGSIRETEDLETFYYTTTHALLSLCKKLAVEKQIVRQDGIVKKDREIEKLIDIILFNVKKP